MKKIILLIFTFFALASCSSYRNQNKVLESEMIFKGGVSQNESWDDPLIFKRTSWYRGATLAYDFLISEIESTNKFSRWFASSGKQYLLECHKFYVAMLYTHNLEAASIARFRAQLEKQGLDERVVNEFAANIKAHFTYDEWNLNTYKIVGYCAQSKDFDPSKVLIKFPGFIQAQVLRE